MNVRVCPESLGPVLIAVAQLATVCAVASSLTVWSAPLVKLGTSFTAVTVTGTAIAVAEASRPSHAFTVNAEIVPFAFAAGVHTSDSPVANVVVPPTTALPPLVNVPLDTASIRKFTGVESTSASSAAARSVV